jgi:single-stranded DNA-specific DHH superfamily exonuclease
MLKREKDKERKKLKEECKKIAEERRQEERELQKRKKRQREENALRASSYQVVCVSDWSGAVFFCEFSRCVIVFLRTVFWSHA